MVAPAVFLFMLLVCSDQQEEELETNRICASFAEIAHEKIIQCLEKRNHETMNKRNKNGQSITIEIHHHCQLRERGGE